MKPITIALLATLVPTIIIILLLVCLSVFLYFKLRASRISHKALEQQPQTTAKRQSEAEPPSPTACLLPTTSPALTHPESPRQPSIEQAKLLSTCNENPKALRDIPEDPESWMKAKLEATGYDRAPLGVIMKHLVDPKTRSFAITHIAVSVALAETDLGSESSTTALSFSPELRRDLLKVFKSLEGKAFGREFSNLLSKMPSQIINEYGAINKEKLKIIIDGLQELFVPFVEKDGEVCYWVNENKQEVGLTEKTYVEAFTKIVALQLKMLTSRQQFKFRWDETNESSICCKPDLCSYAGKDVVPLDEPIVWSSGGTIYIADDGSLSSKPHATIVIGDA